MGDLLEQGGNVLVWPGGRLSQVPRPSGWFVRAPLGKDLVGLPALVIGGELHDSRPDQRVPKRHPARRAVEGDHPCPIGGDQVAGL